MVVNRGFLCTCPCRIQQPYNLMSDLQNRSPPYQSARHFGFNKKKLYFLVGKAVYDHRCRYIFLTIFLKSWFHKFSKNFVDIANSSSMGVSQIGDSPNIFLEFFVSGQHKFITKKSHQQISCTVNLRFKLELKKFPINCYDVMLRFTEREIQKKLLIHRAHIISSRLT